MLEAYQAGDFLHGALAALQCGASRIGTQSLHGFRRCESGLSLKFP